ncbi:MAG TPA: stage 0 sporulation family protein [Acholeplasma sp.]|jgi:cell fate regulator YaaT (PSP1 superfamily)|nr:stage 0 sporulation family protein [Acholeplasmatales bacterium]HHV33709.1 stage 0 sporulation family protein [Acholeplasma sp.]
MYACEIRFRDAGKRYYFDPLDFKIEVGMLVVVETIRGIEIGEIVNTNVEVAEDFGEREIKPIIRIATEEDIQADLENQQEEKEIILTTKQLAKENELEMKILAAEYTLDKDCLVIYFEAEGRVDFRQLVRDLNSVYRTRIELRQVGPRDAAKFIGGLGPCGLMTCCSTFIGTFENISIKMAKNQNLSLNPRKISGSCGKLLCCIKYEDELYDEMRVNMPDIGDMVVTPDGEGKVIAIQIIRQKVRVLFEEGNAANYEVKDVKRKETSQT